MRKVIDPLIMAQKYELECLWYDELVNIVRTSNSHPNLYQNLVRMGIYED